jgi:branched-subunit amino acid transport protein
VSADLVWLALFMGLATYPWRALPLLAPGMHRLPAQVQEYLRLMGPAILATLAAVAVMVTIDDARHPSFHVGIEWLAVAACIVLVASRRGLLLGLLAAAGIAGLARAAGLA